MDTTLRSLLEAVASLGRGQPADRRSGNRLPAHGLVSIRQDVQGTSVEMVTLLDVSERGLSFRTRQSLAPEQKVLAEPQTGSLVAFERFEAVVRHVEPDGQEFIVGAEFVPSNKESLEAIWGDAAAAEMADDGSVR